MWRCPIKEHQEGQARRIQASPSYQFVSEINRAIHQLKIPQRLLNVCVCVCVEATKRNEMKRTKKEKMRA